MSARRTVLSLGCLLLTLAPVVADAEDDAALRKQIARLTEEVSQRLRQIAELEARLGEGEPHVGLEGYCPVTLMDDLKWETGNPELQATFAGCTFRFVDAQQRQKFRQSPEKYAPMLGGYDPVLWLDHGERAPGRRRHGLFYKGKIVLLASEATLTQFYAQPERYATFAIAPPPSAPAMTDESPVVKNSESSPAVQPQRRGRWLRRRWRNR